MTHQSISADEPSGPMSGPISGPMSGPMSGPVEKLDKVEISVQLDPELLEQIQHLTRDPSKVIEVAVRQWLRGGAGREDDLTRPLRQNPPVPPRGEWND